MRQAVVGSIVFGAVCGLIDPRQLYSVEIAQAVSGVLPLPPQAPMALHNGRVFSLFIDAAALLLRAGVSTELLCRVLTMVMGAITCLAVTTAAYAFTANRLIALAAPAALLSGLTAPLAVTVHKYDLGFPVGDNDLGHLGFYVALLVLSIVALRPSVGVALLPIAVAAHVSLGLMACAIVAAGSLVDRQLARTIAQHWRHPACTALGVVLVWVAHQCLAAPTPAAPPVDPRYTAAAIEWWDVHRMPVRPGAGIREMAGLFNSDVLFLAVAVLALASPLPLFHRVRFWIAGQMAVTVLAIIATVGDELYPAWGPLSFHALMLSRWLNMNLILVPLVVTALLLNAFKDHQWPAGLTRLCRPAVAFAVAVVLAFHVTLNARLDAMGPHQPFLQKAGQRPGLFLVAGLNDLASIQLRTGRAPLLDWQYIETLAYAPEMGTGIERILNDFYGITLLTPEAWAAFDRAEVLWQQRSPQQWRDLRHRYDVVDLIVPRSWRLQLPLVDSTSELALYTIPD